MKTLNSYAAAFFVLLFALALICTFDLVEAAMFTFVVSVPLYLMGVGFRWVVRGVVS
jgi:hypothetical protein